MELTRQMAETTRLFNVSLRPEMEFSWLSPARNLAASRGCPSRAERKAQDEMRITENTPVRLTLRDRTLWISVVCFAAAGFQVAWFAAHDGTLSELVPAALSVAFGLAFLRATDVTLDKIGRICAMRRFDIIRAMRKQLAFHEIMDIKIEVCPGDSISCRLSLVTATVVVPLTVGYEPDLPRHNAMRDTLLDVLCGDALRPASVDPILALVAEGRIIDAIKVLRLHDRLSLSVAGEDVVLL
jgi:hypothetical protein